MELLPFAAIRMRSCVVNLASVRPEIGQLRNFGGFACRYTREDVAGSCLPALKFPLESPAMDHFLLAARNGSLTL